MFNLSENSKLRGSGFRILNVLRVCNIVALLTVTVASWVMIVMTGMRNQFYFFDATTHFFAFCSATFLIASELQFGWFGRYFPSNWPILGPDHSFFWLGAFMIYLGCSTLGNLNKPAFTIENLGLPLWRLVLAAGILSITFGFSNIITSIVFRDGDKGITARMIRRDGNLASAKVDTLDDYYSARTASLRQKEDSGRMKRVTQIFKSPFGGSKKPKISAPIITTTDVETGSTGDDWHQQRASPIVPDMQRPPTAMHPAYTGGNHSIHYSVADMDRF